MAHPAISPGRVAVITGGASGIGLAVAERLVDVGMKVCVADRDVQALARVQQRLGGSVLTHSVDVSDYADVQRLRDKVMQTFGEVTLLMNNAGTGGGGGAFTRLEGWQRVLSVNLWGVVHGLQAFTQLMIDQGTPCAIVNTGSKQGITNPPGDAAYNVSKAGIRSVTESLAHELRNIEGCQVSAHLLVPGFTYTGMIRSRIPERPPAAWLPDQVAERLLTAMSRGDFYVVCEDNDVSRAMDNARIQWNTDDILKNRPALSRWHADFAQAYAEYVDGV